jgi:hypothetical protein
VTRYSEEYKKSGAETSRVAPKVSDRVRSSQMPGHRIAG